MNRENICCIIGHDRWYYDPVLECHIECSIRELVQSGVDTFFNLWYNGFDVCCAQMIDRIKTDFPHIRQYQIIANPNTDQKVDLFDNSIHIRREMHAHSDRVDWALAHSGHALCFVRHSFGMAEIYMHKAEEAGLQIHRITPPEYHYPCG